MARFLLWQHLAAPCSAVCCGLLSASFHDSARRRTLLWGSHGAAFVSLALSLFAPRRQRDNQRNLSNRPRRWSIYVAIGISGGALSSRSSGPPSVAATGRNGLSFSIILAVFLIGLGAGIASGRFGAHDRPRVVWAGASSAGGRAWTAFVVAESLPYWPVDVSIHELLEQLSARSHAHVLGVVSGHVFVGLVFPWLAAVIGERARRLSTAQPGTFRNIVGADDSLSISSRVRRRQEAPITRSSYSCLVLEAGFLERPEIRTFRTLQQRWPASWYSLRSAAASG